MNLKEARQKDDKELLFDLKELRKELFDLRFQAATEKVQSPARIRDVRRDIARILTLLEERRAGIRGATPRGGSVD